MNWNMFATHLISAFLLPPLNLIALCAVGYMLRKRWPKVGASLSILSLATLLFISTKYGALLLTTPLEKMSAPLISAYGAKAEAIVVLGGGQNQRAAEYGGKNVPNAITLVRLRYAAKLHNETGLPVLVTGGAPYGGAQSEAAQMARVLREDFSVPVMWLEEKSNNTAQNAQFSAALLNKVGVRKILLVTDAIHMPRSKRVFFQAGFDVVPAPTQFASDDNISLYSFIPSGHALYIASYAMHEWVGMLWYRLRY